MRLWYFVHLARWIPRLQRAVFRPSFSFSCRRALRLLDSPSLHFCFSLLSTGVLGLERRRQGSLIVGIIHSDSR